MKDVEVNHIATHQNAQDFRLWKIYQRSLPVQVAVNGFPKGVGKIGLAALGKVVGIRVQPLGGPLRTIGQPFLVVPPGKAVCGVGIVL